MGSPTIHRLMVSDVSDVRYIGPNATWPSALSLCIVPYCSASKNRVKRVTPDKELSIPGRDFGAPKIPSRMMYEKWAKNCQ